MELNYDNFYSFNNSPFHQNYEENGIFTSKSPANFEDGLYIFDNQNLNYFQQFTGVSSQQKNFELPKVFLFFNLISKIYRNFQCPFLQK